MELIIDRVSKQYKNKIAVDRISVKLQQGVYGLLGANGAGKSSTIECILGTKKMDGGEVRILGMNPVKDRTRVFEKVGVQFQESKYQDLLKVEELCEMTASLYRETGDFETLLQMFGIADKKKTYVKELSGGERQRLFIVNGGFLC